MENYNDHFSLTVDNTNDKNDINEKQILLEIKEIKTHTKLMYWLLITCIIMFIFSFIFYVIKIIFRF